MQRQLPMRQVREAAMGRIGEVLSLLAIAVPARGHSLSLCNPIRGEKNPSLQIWIKPGFEGAWKDHGAGIAGDVIDLVAYFKGWSNGGDKRGRHCAADFLAHELGLAAMDAAAYARLKADNAARRATAVRERVSNDEAAQRIAFAMWLKGKPLAGSVAEKYLLTRGVDLRKLAKPPSAIRCLPAHKHLEMRAERPVMIAKMQDGDGITRAVHRTWLEWDGSDKAIGFEPQRKIWPAFTGCVVPLARGASGLPVKEACAAGIADELVLTEGIEKGLALAMADHRPRIWAFASLANLAHVPVPDCATEIIVAADNDIGNYRAAQLLARGVEYLRSFGRPVAVVKPKLGKDADELLRGEEQDDG